MIKNLKYFAIVSLLPMLSSCSVINGIFKAGMWWAFFLVFIVIALIVWALTKSKK